MSEILRKRKRDTVRDSGSLQGSVAAGNGEPDSEKESKVMNTTNNSSILSDTVLPTNESTNTSVTTHESIDTGATTIGPGMQSYAAATIGGSVTQGPKVCKNKDEHPSFEDPEALQKGYLEEGNETTISKPEEGYQNFGETHKNKAKGYRRRNRGRRQRKYDEAPSFGVCFQIKKMPDEAKRFPLLEFTDHLKAVGAVDAHFNKKFTFDNSKDGCALWKLPEAETMFTKEVWQDEELQSLKTALNDVKKQLTDKEIASWHIHTKKTNPTDKILVNFKLRLKAEMITQAWLKFYEIVSSYPILPSPTFCKPEKDGNEKDGEDVKEGLEKDAMKKAVQDAGDEENSEEVNGKGDDGNENDGDDGNENDEEGDDVEKEPFHSIHLCEAPGAFIAALNHYLVLWRPTLKWQWLGSTLNPYYEGSPAEICIVEDKLIYPTMSNWMFGKSNTGDLMNKENLEDIIEQANHVGPIQLVTADGSIDCQSNPGEQEITTQSLHLCEAITSLSVLAVGGSFVIKKFTMFECQTVCLMYFLCCVFKEVHVIKPGTSKEGNSEVYVVCLNYLGKEVCKPHLAKLVEPYGQFKTELALFNREDIPSYFLEQLKKCMEIFNTHQVNAINKNISLYEKMTEKEEQYMEVVRNKAIVYYNSQFVCKRIPKDCTLTDNKVSECRYLLDSDLSKPITSALIRTTLPLKKFNLLKKYMSIYIEEFTRRDSTVDMEKGDQFNLVRFPLKDLEKIEFEVVRGKPYSTIKSSKFCSLKIQESFRMFYHLWEANKCVSDLSPGERVLDCVIGKYPKALVLRSKVTPEPTCDLGGLLDALTKIKDKELAKKDSLILFNVTLLSRLQSGFLLLLGSVFENVALYTSPELGKQAPVIVLENFKSLEKGEALMTALNETGGDLFNGNPVTSHTVLQIVSYPLLIEKQFLNRVYYYNLNHCIHRSLLLQKDLEATLT